MKTSKRQIVAVLSACLFIGIHAVTAAPYVWTNQADGTHNWNVSGNWNAEGIAPDGATEQVQFNNTVASGVYTVLLDDSKTLEAGLLITASQSNFKQTIFDLNGKTLTLDGGSLSVVPSSAFAYAGPPLTRALATFNNGTVQLGGDNPTSLVVGNATSSAGNVASNRVISVVFGSTATLNTANTPSISVASNDGAYENNMMLDLSAAKLISGDDTETRALKVTDSIGIGQNTLAGPASGRHRYGQLLMGVVEEMSIGNDLIIGQNLRNTSSTAAVNGTLQFSTAPAQGELNLSIGRDLRIGIGASATGAITDVPEELNLTVGSEITRGGVVYVGYKNVTNAAAAGNASGTFVSTGGTISTYITELRVGQNDHATNGTATGTFDFEDATLGVLDISGDAVIGQGLGADGTVRLSGGQAKSQNLTVGGISAGTGLLELNNGTRWEVGNTLQIGTLGDVVLKSGAQIDLLSDDTTKLTINGELSVYFDDANPYWGIRILGTSATHISLFQDYIDTDKLVGMGAYGDLAGVFTDDTYTYFGIVPEPSTALLLLLGGFGIMVLRRCCYLK